MSESSAAPWRYALSETILGDEEIAGVTAVLRQGWLTQGPLCLEFEQRFAELLGVPAEHSKVVSSCTAGLHLALAALGVAPGDEVIVPSLSFVATANCVRYLGAVPVFADILGPDEPTIDPADVALKISPRTRGVICMHYAGFAARLPELVRLCRDNNLFLVEDVAHAPGAALEGRMLGTWGDAGCFSFFSNKNLAMGEGGLVVMREASLASRVGRMRSHGMTSVTLDRHKGHAFSYDVVELGFNFRITELAAALGLAQLDRLAAGNARRGELTARYRELLGRCDAIQLPFLNAPGNPAYHIFPMVLAPEVDRHEFMLALRQRGIQTSIHYPPIHLFTDFRKNFGTTDGLLPTTEDYAAREVTLPLHPGLTVADIEIIAGEVIQALESQ